MLAITTPFAQFFDTDGSPLDQGYIYLGQVNQNPETTPVPIFWDLAGTIPAAQPIRTLNGTPARAGAPAAVYTADKYSVAIKSKRGVVIAYAAEWPTVDLALSLSGPGGAALIGHDGVTVAQYFKSRSNRVVDSVAALKMLDSTKYTRVFVSGYYAAGDGGGGFYHLDATDTTSVDNLGLVVVAVDNARWKLALSNTVTAEQMGVKGGGTENDAATLQAAINAASAAGLSQLRLTNKAGYRIAAQVVQPYNLQVCGDRTLIRCETVPATGAAWVLEYSPWTSNVDRYYVREPLEGILFQGHASPADGVWTAGLHGVELRSYHQVLRNVTCAGFDRNFCFGKSGAPTDAWLAWEVKFEQCVSFYGQFGLHVEVAGAAGLAGAGITWSGGVLGHNDYTVFNNCAELTFIDAASDSPKIAHVKDNLNVLSGNDVGFMHWQNSRIEAGGQSGIPWITNSGTMRFTDTFFVERNGSEFIFFNNPGSFTALHGGSWRTSDGRYKAAGTGIMTQHGVKPLNDANGVLLTYANSGVLNGDLRDETTSGFGVASGAAALLNVADAGFFGAGRALDILATAFPCAVESSTIELDQSCSNFALTCRAVNTNGSDVVLRLRQVNKINATVSQISVNVPAGASYLPLSLKGRRFPNSAECLVSVELVAGQTSGVRVSDFYLTQW